MRQVTIVLVVFILLSPVNPSATQTEGFRVRKPGMEALLEAVPQFAIRATLLQIPLSVGKNQILLCTT